jgi:hypothetical protein
MQQPQSLLPHKSENTADLADDGHLPSMFVLQCAQLWVGLLGYVCSIARTHTAFNVDMVLSAECLGTACVHAVPHHHRMFVHSTCLRIIQYKQRMRAMRSPSCGTAAQL